MSKRCNCGFLSFAILIGSLMNGAGQAPSSDKNGDNQSVEKIPVNQVNYFLSPFILYSGGLLKDLDFRPLIVGSEEYDEAFRASVYNIKNGEAMGWLYSRRGFDKKFEGEFRFKQDEGKLVIVEGLAGNDKLKELWSKTLEVREFWTTLNAQEVGHFQNFRGGDLWIFEMVNNRNYLAIAMVSPEYRIDQEVEGLRNLAPYVSVIQWLINGTGVLNRVESGFLKR